MTTPEDRAVVVRMRGIVKRFGPTLANDGIDFDLREGEIHVLLGENGAGKTTLVNILFGHVQPDAGAIELRGQEVVVRSPAKALECGIGMVHQHFSLVPSFTVAENVVLGSRPPTAASYDRSGTEREVQQVADRVGLDVRVAARVGDLPVEEQQRVEILKALYRGAGILLLDEPTALLGPVHVQALLADLADLRAQGTSMVLVTHKLAEVVEVADRVTVLRHGRRQLERERGTFDERSLAAAMTGHDVQRRTWRAATGRARQEPALETRGLVARGDEGQRGFDGIDLRVDPGEIVGVAGVEGNGQRELVEVLTGLRAPDAGTVRVGGQVVRGHDPRALRSAGVGIIPQDRRLWGLVGDMTLAENLALPDIAAGVHSRHGLLRWKDIRSDARRLLEEYDVRPPEPVAKASALSGGNQQKVVLARELSRSPVVLIADNPTWGIDVGGIQYVHGRLCEVRDAGTAVLLFSLDLDEVAALADRVVVMFRGKVMLDAPSDGLSMDAVALAMVGRSAGSSAAPEAQARAADAR